MLTITDWMPEALRLLRNEFGERLLYLGLQGRYRRCEANDNSDIDLMTILDKAGLDDLDRYRKIVHAMPEGEKACGFICGREEMRHWPRHEVFAFGMDTGRLSRQTGGVPSRDESRRYRAERGHRRIRAVPYAEP